MFSAKESRLYPGSPKGSLHNMTDECSACFGKRVFAYGFSRGSICVEVMLHILQVFDAGINQQGADIFKSDCCKGLEFWQGCQVALIGRQIILMKNLGLSMKTLDLFCFC